MKTATLVVLVVLLAAGLLGLELGEKVVAFASAL